MQTTIKYQDTALPIVGTPVTLFNSVTAFPPGGSFHLLNQQWFQYNIKQTTTAGSGTAVVTGEFSEDKGATWIVYYTSGSITDTGGREDEVYVGGYKDVRFRALYSTNATTVFNAILSLNDCKPTSKVTVNAVLVDG